MYILTVLYMKDLSKKNRTFDSDYSNNEYGKLNKELNKLML